MIISINAENGQNDGKTSEEAKNRNYLNITKTTCETPHLTNSVVRDRASPPTRQRCPLWPLQFKSV